MRLICPNCGAQYEVPAEAIPPAGRDVQCSACGRTWFERPGDPPAPAPEEERDPWDGIPRVEDDDEEADDLAEAAVAPLPRVKAEVAEILQAEARREAEARANQGAAPRPAPVVEAPAPAVAPPPRPVETALRERPGPAPVAPSATLRPSRGATRTDREIDLDRISSTLQSVPRQRPPLPPPVESRRSGFGTGFWSGLLLLLVLALAYAFAPRLAAAVPAAAPALGAYADTVDSLRDWLDRQVGEILPGTAASGE